MTKEELNYIKDSFSQIIDDIAGNREWDEAARAIASGLGIIERKLETKVVELPSNLDEAAEESMPEEEGFLEIDIYGGSEAVYSREQMLAMFKVGAEWMAGQYKFIKAHCVEFSNPVSESPYQRLHLITLLYEEDEDTPYVIGGDNIEIYTRKK